MSKKVKKIIALILSLVMVTAVLASCSDGSGEQDSSVGTAGGSQSTTGGNSSNPGTPATSAEEHTEQIAAASKDTGASSVAEYNDAASIVDSSRKSTYNSDERKDEIKVMLSQEMKTWAPWGVSQGRNGGAEQSIFECLFWTVDSTEMSPCLAKEWNEVDDTHFDVTIYDYITDTDGNNLTAEDVAAAYKYFAASGNASNFQYFADAEAIDTYTVRFTWTDKITTLVHLPAMMQAPLYTQKAFQDHDLGTDPVGTGPYKLASSVSGSQYVLTANEDYWQKDESLLSIYSHRNVNKIIYEVVSDSSMQYISFQEGGYAAVRLNSQTLPDFKEGGKNYGEFPMAYLVKPSANGIGFNCSGNSIMADKNLRLAVAYAIDSAGIVAALGSDLYYQQVTEGGSAAGGFNVEWLNDSTYYNTYDPELAKDYLAKSSYNNETIMFLSESNDEQRSLASQIIKQQLEEIGIKVDLQFYELATFNTYQADLTSWDIEFYVQTGNYLARLWGGLFDKTNYDTGYSRTGIDDAKLQEMIEVIQTRDGNTAENRDEFRDYITENCYTYAIYGATWTYALDPSIASMAGEDYEHFYYGSFNYYLDV